MVKRIKKRIPKQDTPEDEVDGIDVDAADGEAEIDDDGGLDAESDGDPKDIRAQLTDLADDEFTRKTASIFGWIIEKKTILIALLVIGLGAVGVYVFSQRSKDAASEEAAAAFQAGADPYVEAASEAEDAAKRTAGVEKAATAFEAARTQYGDRRISALATLGLAGARFDQGKAADAQGLYDDFLNRPDTDPFAKAIALQGKAVALEEKGDLAGASEAWKALEGMSREAYGLLAGLQIGRLLEAQGKAPEAKAHYGQLQKDYATALDELPNRSFKAEVERRLAALSGNPT